jgi:hypothetical protein
LCGSVRFAPVTQASRPRAVCVWVGAGTHGTAPCAAVRRRRAREAELLGLETSWLPAREGSSDRDVTEVAWQSPVGIRGPRHQAGRRAAAASSAGGV